MAKLRVFFAYTQNMGVTWWRFINPAKWMRKEKGVEIAYSKYTPYDSEVIKWEFEVYDPVTRKENETIMSQLNILCECADIVVTGNFVALQGLAWFAAAKTKFKKPFVLEIDDYIFNPPEYNQAAGGLRQGGLGEYLTAKELNIADSIIVSTPYLKKLYSQFNENIFIVPNGIDFEIYDNLKKKPRESERVRIGFAGSPNHIGDFKLIKDVLLDVLKDNPNSELLLAGVEPDYFKDHPQVKFVDNWVPITEYPQMLSDMNLDIGIAPLKDNNLNRAKSNLKWMEYSAVKVPTVATNIEHFKDSIDSGETGFLCDTEQEWYNALTHLIRNNELRQAMGMRAYNEVKGNWNIRKIAKDYIKTLQRIRKIYKAKE